MNTHKSGERFQTRETGPSEENINSDLKLNLRPDCFHTSLCWMSVWKRSFSYLVFGCIVQSFMYTEILYKSLSLRFFFLEKIKDGSMAGGGGAPYRNLNTICLLNMKVLSNTGNYSDSRVPVVILDANYEMSVGLGLTTLWKQMAETLVTSSYFTCVPFIFSV